MLSSPSWLSLPRPMASSKLSPRALIQCQHSDTTRCKITDTSLMMPVRVAMAQIASRLLPIIFALYQPQFMFSASCNNTFGPMFESLSTLHNCFMFASVADGSFQNAGANQTAVKLHFVDDERNTTADNVARVLEGCLSEYCGTVPTCKEYLQSQALRDDYVGYRKSQELASSICNTIPSSINSDVGGVGVSSVPSTRTSVLCLC